MTSELEIMWICNILFSLSINKKEICTKLQIKVNISLTDPNMLDTMLVVIMHKILFVGLPSATFYWIFIWACVFSLIFTEFNHITKWTKRFPQQWWVNQKKSSMKIILSWYTDLYSRDMRWTKPRIPENKCQSKFLSIESIFHWFSVTKMSLDRGNKSQTLTSPQIFLYSIPWKSAISFAPRL